VCRTRHSWEKHARGGRAGKVYRFGPPAWHSKRQVGDSDSGGSRYDVPGNPASKQRSHQGNVIEALRKSVYLGTCYRGNPSQMTGSPGLVRTRLLRM
jgi:hypothetical protein